MCDDLKRYAAVTLIFFAWCLHGGEVCRAENDTAGSDKREEISQMLRDAGGVLSRDPKRASALASRALKLCDTAHPDSLTIAATILYGEAEQLLGNFDLSIHILYDAEGLIDKDDARWRARLYKLQGRVFSKLGDYHKSAELNDKATSMFKVLGDSAMVADCYNERGVMLLNLHEYAVAEHFFHRALDINMKLSDLAAVAKNLNCMCLYKGDTADKLGKIDQAISINSHLGNTWALGENYNNKGKQLYYAGRYGEAMDALGKAKSYIDTIEAKELLCDNYEYMSMVSAASGDYRNAYEYLGKMSSLTGELQKNTRLRNAELDLSRKTLEDQRLAIERQEQDYRIKIIQRNVVLFVIFIVLCVVCLALYLIKIRHKKNLQLIEARHELEVSSKEVAELKVRQQQLELENVQNTLEANRREMISFAAFLKSRNEMTDKIRDMLKEGYKMDPAMIVPHLKKINALITSYCSNDKTSQPLLLSVEEKNKDFMNRLRQKHPDLTKGERNLALLIRGRISTKEISMLLGLEPRTVNMNRYRLRKSLGLKSEDDLEEYLRNV